jgi:predicted nucleotide-binding protein (sugar kinase/HSP70/actin superfamily)
MKLAPIILFAYNRPWHTRQTLEALQRNKLANESTLYIYADGLKEGATEEQKKGFKETRSLLLKKNWCNEVHVVERTHNYGLAANVIDGVSEIVNSHGKVIVLEDDNDNTTTATE